MSGGGEEDIVLRLLHTADWHLGRRFRRFGEEQSLKLSRSRLDVLDRIFLSAERSAVDAVLCAGDLFDEPIPDPEWWEQLAARLAKRKWTNRPVFLLPGNHDPLLPDSVWTNAAFRKRLPDWVHIVDREDFEFALSNRAVLYAVPCVSRSGARDPTEAIPRRAPGDDRIRVGMVHGSTFDVNDWETNFPIAVDAVLSRGLDYLAIGDTHGFRFIPPDRKHPPTIYPGTPEPTAFDEKDPGSVALVFIDRQGRAQVRPERVARWTWEDVCVRSVAEMRALASRTDLADRVLRLRVEMRVSAPEYEEMEHLFAQLQGTSARQAMVGILALDRQGLELETGDVESFCDDLPDALQSTVRRLKAAADDPAQRFVAQRALYHLYRMSRKKAS
ncbi:MAG: DNA repair exonuclease [Polyangiaceae bacterium]|jgi:DNA repair exonuclease SbcCD nuclease subunit